MCAARHQLLSNNMAGCRPHQLWGGHLHDGRGAHARAQDGEQRCGAHAGPAGVRRGAGAAAAAGALPAGDVETPCAHVQRSHAPAGARLAVLGPRSAPGSRLQADCPAELTASLEAALAAIGQPSGAATSTAADGTPGPAGTSSPAASSGEAGFGRASMPASPSAGSLGSLTQAQAQVGGTPGGPAGRTPSHRLRACAMMQAGPRATAADSPTGLLVPGVLQMQLAESVPRGGVGAASADPLPSAPPLSLAEAAQQLPGLDQLDARALRAQARADWRTQEGLAGGCCCTHGAVSDAPLKDGRMAAMRVWGCGHCSAAHQAPGLPCRAGCGGRAEPRAALLAAPAPARSCAGSRGRPGTTGGGGGGGVLQAVPCRRDVLQPRVCMGLGRLDELQGRVVSSGAARTAAAPAACSSSPASASAGVHCAPRRCCCKANPAAA